MAAAATCGRTAAAGRSVACGCRLQPVSELYLKDKTPIKRRRRRLINMSVLPRGYECFRPCPRYGCVQGEWSIYYKRPRCGQPRPQPFQRECTPCCFGPSNAPCEPPCCYDFPCKAHCFNHGACTRPSGRYARTVWYPGECCPRVPPCQAFTCPNPPYHPCCYHTCNKHV